MNQQADTKPACFNCGMKDWTIGTAMLGILGSDLRLGCEVTECAICGFYYLTDEQVETAYKKLHERDTREPV